MNQEKIKVRDHDGTTRWVATVNSNKDQVGAMVADGSIEERDRLDTIIRLYEGQLNAKQRQYVEQRTRAEAAEAKLATTTEALERVSRDMNWQANSGERLNMFVFDYIDATLAEIKG
jgi:membrane-bound lytic murein transglycosylase MltF